MPREYVKKKYIYEQAKLQLKKMKLNCLSEKKRIKNRFLKRNYIDYNTAVTLSPTFRNYVDKMEQQIEYMDNYVINGEIAVIVVTHYLDGLINNSSNDLRIIELLEKHRSFGFTLEEMQEVLKLNFATEFGTEFNFELSMLKELVTGLIDKNIIIKTGKGSK